MVENATASIGIDVGGTFTDLVLHDESRGITHSGKLLTTAEAPSVAILNGVRQLLSETGTEPGQIRTIVHGTTLVTNTLLERTGVKVGLLCTEGFRDVIEMGGEIRYDVDDLFLEPVPVLVPRHRRIGIAGRMMADGTERSALDEASIQRVVRQMVEGERIQALAIAFLHSYRNPAHELRARKVVQEIYPDLLVSLSSEVAPEIREYERANTTCVNAYVQPIVDSYLERLEGELADLGFQGD